MHSNVNTCMMICSSTISSPLEIKTPYHYQLYRGTPTSQTQDTFPELRKYESCGPLLPAPPLRGPGAGPGREDQHPGHQGAGLPPLRHGRGRGIPHRQGEHHMNKFKGSFIIVS